MKLIRLNKKRDLENLLKARVPNFLEVETFISELQSIPFEQYQKYELEFRKHFHNEPKFDAIEIVTKFEEDSFYKEQLLYSLTVTPQESSQYENNLILGVFAASTTIKAIKSRGIARYTQDLIAHIAYAIAAKDSPEKEPRHFSQFAYPYWNRCFSQPDYIRFRLLFNMQSTVEDLTLLAYQENDISLLCCLAQHSQATKELKVLIGLRIGGLKL